MSTDNTPPFIVLKKPPEKLLQGAGSSESIHPSIDHSTTSNQLDTSYIVKIENLEIIKEECLENICRVCLKEGCNPIYDKDSTERIAEKIQEYGRIEVDEDDSFPNLICNSCLALLQAAILFRTTAQESDQKLRYSKHLSESHIRLERDSLETLEEHAGDDASSHLVSNVETLEEHAGDDASSHLVSNVETLEEHAGDDASSHLVSNVSKSRAEAKHKADTILTCKKCDISFKGNSEYLRHIRSQEHKNGRVRCGECGVMVVSSYLNLHVQRMHTLERPYVCEVCGKAFVALGPLKTHALVHTTVLKFACSECPYRGRYFYSLLRHRRVHTGEKPYACGTCPARFCTKTNLNTHARTHLTKFAYKCGQCNKGFHKMRDKIEHEKVQHLGIKEHQCNICGNEFGHRKGLMQHLRLVHHMAKGQEKSKQDNASQDSRGPDDTQGIRAADLGTEEKSRKKGSVGGTKALCKEKTYREQDANE